MTENKGPEVSKLGVLKRIGTPGCIYRFLLLQVLEKGKKKATGEMGGGRECTWPAAGLLGMHLLFPACRPLLSGFLITCSSPSSPLFYQ